MNGAASGSLEEWLLGKLNRRVTGSFADDPLKSLTVIVPSYNRQSFLLRQIAYWQNTEAEVILLDGSPDPLSQRVREALRGIPHIQYLHIPEHFTERLAVAGRMIDTPYTVLLGDDEFHLHSGLREAIRHLNKNADVAGCIGQSINFYVSKTNKQIAYGSGYSHYKYEAWEEDVLERFEQAMDSYNAATCYAVLRTDVWKDSWASLLNTSCKDIWEIQQTLTTYSAGKFSTVDHIYWLRSHENVSVAESNHFKTPSFPTWWSSTKYADERQRVVEEIASVIRKHTHIPIAESEHLARSGLEMFNRFYQRSYPPISLFNPGRMKGLFVSFLKSVMPMRFYRALKNRVAPKVEMDPLRVADIGAREVLALEKCRNLFKFEAETDRELQSIEALILDFYKHY